ncbi:S-layer homology domain-containing protein [Paenibacillus sp. GSMTC-2017]|uniref:S-layer homology domain-containing protein n=1 Tax=Paenibacillus sp. GSMTC-2017 TaxID=2794350 RepID=UPI001E359447|nr:S-layer homology domain-containing protein [Paenibacillus sp. GSMTC-2017]
MMVVQILPAPVTYAATQTVTMDKPAFIQGKPITLSFTGGTLNDWIGLYPKGAEPKGSNPSLTWAYPKNNPNGKISFSKVLAPGEYEALYMENDGYNIFQRVPFSVITLNPPSGVTFTDTDSDASEVAGEVHISPPANAANVTSYTLYWGNDIGKLPGQPPIASLSPDLGGLTYAVHTFSDNTAIPIGATKLIAYSGSDAGETDSGVETSIPGIVLEKPIAKFQVLSDMHIMGDPNHIHNKHLDDTLKDIAALSPDSDGIMTVGDNTENGTEAQYKELARIFDLYKDQLPESFFIEGNHDVRWADWDNQTELFKKYTNMTSKYYDVWIKGVHFIFLGTEKGLKDYSYLTDEQLKWLDEKLSEDAAANKPVFVFHHQPLKNTVSGTQVSKNPSFYWYGVRQDKEFKTILSKHPQAILFSGHTHWELGSMDTMYNAKYSTMFNTAATSYLWTDSNASKVGNQGYFVEVYDNKVLVKGRDFMNDKWIANAQFEVKLPVSIPVVDPSTDPDLNLGHPTLSMTDNTHAPGASLKVDYTGSVAKDWIGIFPEGTKLNKTTTAIAKKNTNSSVQPNGSLIFEGLSLEPGRYDVVYVGEADYTTSNDNIELGRVTFTIAKEDEVIHTVEVKGENDATSIGTKGGKLQLQAKLIPASEPEATFTWSVVNEDGTATDKASINESGLLTAVKDGKVKVIATWNSNESITASVIITITGQIDSNGGNGGTGGSGGNGGGGGNGGNNTGGGNGNDGSSPEQPGVHTVDITEVNQSAGQGLVTIPVAADTKQLVVPMQIATLLEEKGLTVKKDNLLIDVPAKVISQALLSAGDNKDVKLVLDMALLTKTEADVLMNKAITSTGQSGVSLAGEVYDFSLIVAAANGQTTKISTFEQPIIIRMKLVEGVNPALSGIYYIADNGKLEYVGSEYKDGYMSAEIHHFSNYAVLSLQQNFEDVPASHWAYDAIQSLAAKQIVQGVSETAFEPDRSVTRAEYASMLVRTLMLTEKAHISFDDVASDAWYADTIAIALKSGLVFGKSESSFDPNGKITREEMVVMTMRAYKLLIGKPLEESPVTAFIDEQDIAAWALDDVRAAAALQFVKGRNVNTFVPHGISTRAEAAMLIGNLLK